MMWVSKTKGASLFAAKVCEGDVSQIIEFGCLKLKEQAYLQPKFVKVMCLKL